MMFLNEPTPDVVIHAPAPSANPDEEATEIVIEPRLWVQIHVGDTKYDLAALPTAQHLKDDPSLIDSITDSVRKMVEAFRDGTLESHVNKS